MRDSQLVKDFESYLLERQQSPDGKLEGELELASRFHVSRNSIREVAMHFQFLGVIERTKNKGSFIKQLAYGKLEEVMSFCFQVSGFGFEELKEARLHMEMAIIPLIVRRANPESLARLKENIEAMRASKDDIETAERLDKEFHLALFEICGNRALKIFANVLHLLFRKGYRTRFLNPEAALKSAGDHLRLVEAIEAEDLERAREIVKSHIMPT